MDSEDEEQEKKRKLKAIKRKIKKFKLPKNKLLVIDNPDKKFHEHWKKGRSLCNFPVPFQAIICGKQNVGKGVVVTNLILHQGSDKVKGANKPFEEIYVLHCDGKHTNEYKDCGAIFLDKLPPPESWDDKKKKLLILEDCAIKGFSKVQLEYLKRAIAYVSTHKNLSTVITCQDIYDIGDPLIRRCTNLFVLFPSLDYTSLAGFNRKIGLQKGDLGVLFRKYCASNHDSIWLDMTDNGKSPYKIRRNCFDVIEMHHVS